MIKLRLYNLEAPVVGAAGALAGGAAANAIMGGGKQAPPGGGIPGVTSSQGGGKDGTEGSVPQVDPTQALAYFQQATQAQNAGYTQGINYYNTAINQAIQSINSGYNTSNQTLMPLSYSGQQALNQQMRMLGLDPIQATQGFGSTLNSQLAKFSGTLGLTSDLNYGSSIASAMDAASGIKDPNKRAEALANIQNSISTGNASLIKGIQDQINGINNPSAPTLAQFGLRKDNNGTTIVGPDGGISDYAAFGGVKDSSTSSTGYGSLDTDQRFMQYQQAVADYNKTLEANAAQKSTLQAQLDQANSYASTLSNFGEQFSTAYNSGYDSGYSPEQISEIVTNLPGYQFQLQQGIQAIDRIGASRGMLGSANTALAEQTYGQQQAQSYYNNYMGYLSGISQQGAQATSQLAGQQSNQAQLIAGYQQNLGQAQMGTAQAQADYAAQNLYNSGVLFNQTAMFNAGLQFQGQQNQLNRDAQSAISGLQSGVGYMNASTNAGQLALALSNSKGYGQGFLSSYGVGGGANYNGATARNGWLVA